MPGTEGVQGNGYPTVEAATNLARAIVNDMVFGPAGLTFTDTAAFMIPYLNSAILELEERLSNNGVQTFKTDNVILTPITPVANPSPSLQQNISWLGFFDGNALQTSPVLPSSLRAPLKLWSRVTGSNLPFMPMSQPEEGLESAMQGPHLGTWEWRGDAIWLNGSTQTQDIRIRYIGGIPLIATTANFSTTTIQIRNSTNAIAHLLAKKYGMARGGATTPQLDAEIDKFVKLLVNNEVRQRQAIEYYRRQYGDGGRSSLGGNGF